MCSGKSIEHIRQIETALVSAIVSNTCAPCHTHIYIYIHLYKYKRVNITPSAALVPNIESCANITIDYKRCGLLDSRGLDIDSLGARQDT